ncbi:glycine cleavage system protein R [Agaribacter flavus]|uniref:Glycine cleavage system transcriptional repressor n=1 Tax=Agaribacter flavus TaxID=1902781 RepID=A0ABV7FKY9_9ALTE
MPTMILTVLGKDKVGLVNEIAQAVQTSGGNWLKSSFCYLAGQFAGFVQVTLPEGNQDRLIAACETNTNLRITLTPISTPEDELVQTSPVLGKAFSLRVTGNDRPGIVNDVTSTLQGMNVNIVAMTTSCDSAPNWGSYLFTAELDIECASELNAQDCKDAIEALADDLIVEFDRDF